jgi:hypothetical protein
MSTRRATRVLPKTKTTTVPAPAVTSGKDSAESNQVSKSKAPSKPVAAALKRSAEDTQAIPPGKKTKLDPAAEVATNVFTDTDEDEVGEDSDEENAREGISEEVQVRATCFLVPAIVSNVHPQDRLDYLEGLVGGLTKSYLKEVMRGISVYSGGTNRQMAEAIVDSLTQDAENGSDLKEEESVIKRVHKSCYGGCCEDSDEGEDY